MTAIAEILSPRMLDAINRSTEDAICLPNDVYTAAEFLDAERKTVFAENWIFVGAGAEIPDEGDVLPVMVAGLPLLLRDATGAIRAFHNVCRHRSAVSPIRWRTAHDAVPRGGSRQGAELRSPTLLGRSAARSPRAVGLRRGTVPAGVGR